MEAPKKMLQKLYFFEAAPRLWSSPKQALNNAKDVA